MSEEAIDGSDRTSKLKVVAEKLAMEEPLAGQKGDTGFRRWHNFES